MTIISYCFLLLNLIILSDLVHHLVHHFRIKLHHFMIYYITLLFFKISQNTSKYKVLRSYINLWKSIVRNSINSCLYCSIFLNPPYLWTSVCPCKSVKSSQFYHKFPAISIEELSRPLHCPQKTRKESLTDTLICRIPLTRYKKALSRVASFTYTLDRTSCLSTSFKCYLL